MLPDNSPGASFLQNQAYQGPGDCPYGPLSLSAWKTENLTYSNTTNKNNQTPFKKNNNEVTSKNISDFLTTLIILFTESGTQTFLQVATLCNE